MFSLQLSLLRGDCTALCELRGIVTAGESELLPTFYVALQGTEPRLTEGIVSGVSRWSEPALTFIARCIDSVDLEQVQWNALAFESIDLRVVDWRRRQCTVAHLKAPASQANPWEAAREACLLASTDGIALPPSPSPLNLPVHTFEGTDYCTLGDLPAEARNAAQWVLRPSQRLEHPTRRDAVSVDTMQAFLSNNVDVPRPFRGWLWP